MTDGLHVDSDKRGDLGSFNAEEFGRRIRRFALDAHRNLGCPDTPVDVVFALHARAWSLLQDAPGARSGGIRCWLLAAQQAIADRLHRWATEELDSVVA